MRDRPDGPNLLAAARQALLDELLPALGEEKRLTALMIANAMAIAGRDAAAGDTRLREAQAVLAEIYPERSAEGLDAETTETYRRLALDIRTGKFDASTPTSEHVYRLLMRCAEQQTRINNPKYLDL